MRASPLLATALLLAAAPGGPAAAQAPDPAGIVRGLCSKDGCAEFAILDKQPAGRGPDGALFRTRVQTFHASKEGRAVVAEENGYVYCSTSRPAVLSVPPGKPALAYMLAPDEESPAYVLRNSVNYTAIYFAVCHGNDSGRAAALDRVAVARSLGYHVEAKQPRTVTLARPEDILSPPP